jgi:hypothetical protein
MPCVALQHDWGAVRTEYRDMYTCKQHVSIHTWICKRLRIHTCVRAYHVGEEEGRLEDVEDQARERRHGSLVQHTL